MEQAQQEEDRLTEALAAARTAAVTAEWALHNAIRGAKSQVLAQYGEDSYAVEAIGWKRRSEYRRPARSKSEQERDEADLVTR